MTKNMRGTAHLYTCHDAGCKNSYYKDTHGRTNHKCQLTQKDFNKKHTMFDCNLHKKQLGFVSRRGGVVGGHLFGTKE